MRRRHAPPLLPLSFLLTTVACLSQPTFAAQDASADPSPGLFEGTLRMHASDRLVGSTASQLRVAHLFMSLPHATSVDTFTRPLTPACHSRRILFPVPGRLPLSIVSISPQPEPELLSHPLARTPSQTAAALHSVRSVVTLSNDEPLQVTAGELCLLGTAKIPRLYATRVLASVPFLLLYCRGGNAVPSCHLWRSVCGCQSSRCPLD